MGWTVRFDDGIPPFRVTSEGNRFTFESASERFQLTYHDRMWRSPDAPALAIQSEPAGDYLRRVWTIRTADVTLRASERGSVRSAVRQFGELLSTIPFQFIVPTIVELTSDTAANSGSIRSRRTFPISFRATCDALDAPALAAVAVIVGFGIVG